MAVATRTLKDTAVNAAGAGGKVTVLITFDDETSSDNTVLDASGLDGHANGAMLDITRIWWAINGGVADDDLNWAFLEFKGSSADTLAINLAGTGHYDGTAGPITGNATNATATSGDIEASFRGASGHIILELRKDANWTS
tara:strand:- start:30 stop:452 length:423 start_codon:yes stop_codon:yes gene_type:complete